MIAVRPQGGWIIILTLFIGLCLSIVPLPDWAAPARPQWVLLVLIYWCLAAPQRVGLLVAWFVGLLQDVLHGTLLGQHALAFVVACFIVLKLHQRMRVLPVWQQAISVLVVLLLSRLLVLWINGLINRPPVTASYWLGPIIGTLLWPWVFFVLRETRRHFRVQ